MSCLHLVSFNMRVGFIDRVLHYDDDGVDCLERKFQIVRFVKNVSVGY